MKLPMPFNNPNMNSYKGHSGVDFGQSRGTIIRASGPGKVVSISRNLAGGWWTRVQYDNGPRAGYAHQDKKTTFVKVGDRVKEGDPIGTVGSLGLRSTGPHLHLEIGGEPGFDKVWKYFDRNRVVKTPTPPKPKPTPTTPTEDEDDMATFILERANSQLSKSLYDVKTGRAVRRISKDENTAFRKAGRPAVVYIKVTDAEYAQRGGFN